MTEKCVVKKVRRGLAYIELVRTDACGTCKVCSFNNRKTMTVPAVCDIPVEPGNTVTVQMPEVPVGTGALLVYALPILLMLIGALAGLAGGVWLQVGLVGGGLAIGLAAAALIDRAYRRRQGVLPKVLSVCGGSESAEREHSEREEQNEEKEIRQGDDM